MGGTTTTSGLEGKKGWVIQLKGYHYHNPEATAGGLAGQYVRETLIRDLEESSIGLPVITKEETISNT